jgi:hypothetical protein
MFLNNPRKRPRKNDVFKGIMVIGICNYCGIEGCGDVPVWIATNKKTTTWKTFGKEFIFDAIEYKNEIQKLTDNYYSYSWESEQHKINRFCTEHIRRFKPKNSKDTETDNIDNIFNEISNDTIEIHYYTEWGEPSEDGHRNSWRNFEIKWNGKSTRADWNLLSELSDIFEEGPYMEVAEHSGVMWTIGKNVLENKKNKIKYMLGR